MLNVKVERVPYETPDAMRPAKLTEMNHITKIETCVKKPSGPPVTRIDAAHYVDNRTGELMEYKKTEKRSENVAGVMNTLSHIRDLINCNVTEPSHCRWVTLTYAENMTDTKRLLKDYGAFWKRFKRWCASSGYKLPDYLSVIEPQGRGAWHIHAFFIWPDVAPFVKNDDLRKLWGHGYVTIKAVTDCDNIGAYFSAYLADMPLDDLCKLPADQQEQLKAFKVEEKICADGLSKKIVKGARLHFYPAGMNIVRRSKGIVDPKITWTTYEEAKKKASSAKLTFSDAFQISDEETGKRFNGYTVEYYNAKL